MCDLLTARHTLPLLSVHLMAVWMVARRLVFPKTSRPGFWSGLRLLSLACYGQVSTATLAVFHPHRGPPSQKFASTSIVSAVPPLSPAGTGLAIATSFLILHVSSRHQGPSFQATNMVRILTLGPLLRRPLQSPAQTRAVLHLQRQHLHRRSSALDHQERALHWNLSSSASSKLPTRLPRCAPCWFSPPSPQPRHRVRAHIRRRHLLPKRHPLPLQYPLHLSRHQPHHHTSPHQDATNTTPTAAATATTQVTRPNPNPAAFTPRSAAPRALSSLPAGPSTSRRSCARSRRFGTSGAGVKRLPRALCTRIRIRAQLCSVARRRLLFLSKLMAAMRLARGTERRTCGLKATLTTSSRRPLLLWIRLRRRRWHRREPTG
ncbi:hypothetical protein BKA81DRAFT_358569 [Phyllosticta paracitricarpa]